MAGTGLDARGRIVDGVVAATLRSDECRKGENEWSPGTHVDRVSEIDTVVESYASHAVM